jgi:hypothetical protein
MELDPPVSNFCRHGERCRGRYNVATTAGFVLTNTPFHPPPQATYFLMTFPEQAPAGVAVSVTVVAYDAAGHPVPSYTGMVAFTSGASRVEVSWRAQNRHRPPL